jgi:hypothetical protein
MHCGDSIERSDGDDLADQRYEREREDRIDSELVMLARLALMDRDGHPVTHICGRPIGEVIKLAEAYAERSIVRG